MIFRAVIDERLAQRTVGAHAAGYCYLADTQVFRCFLELPHQYIDDGRLQAGAHVFAQVRHTFGEPVNRLYVMRLQHIAQGIEEGGLEAREGVVIAGDIGLGERIFIRVAELGEFIDPRTARIRQA